LLALLALVLVDIGFYVWDVKNGIAIGSDYRHRWFGDGYVFMTPFLLAMILSNKGLASHGVAKKCLVAAAFLQPALYLLLAVVVLLCGGTGARSTYLVLVCEILFFFILKTRHHGWSWVKILVMSLILLGTLKFAFGFLAPQMLDGAISRGFRIWDRVLYAWGPGILLTSEAPIFGHGFGAAAWDSAFAHLQLNHPEIINFGSPHNWFLAAAFFGGVTALLAQVLLAIGILLFTVRFLARDNQLIKIHLLNNKLDYVCIAVLMSFICFYLIRGLVEFTIYKYMGVLIIIVGLLSVVEENNKK